MMTKMTAVEWLCSQIYTIQVELEAGNNHLKMKIEKAKQMEKTNIKDAFEMGQINAYENHNMDSDDYYLLNFKTK